MRILHEFTQAAGCAILPRIMADQLADTTLAALRTRVIGVLPAQIRAAVATLSDEQLWWRPNESSNSVANLLIHLTGSLNHYLNYLVGGFAYQRDRAAEFAERNAIARAELLARFDDMLANAEKTFDGITPERLAGPAADPRSEMLIEDLVGVAVHFSTHAGQIVWIAKMMHDGALDEIWIRTHKDLGAYKMPN
jgi:uncharacterized damage-inducible protein DinB